MAPYPYAPQPFQLVWPPRIGQTRPAPPRAPGGLGPVRADDIDVDIGPAVIEEPEAPGFLATLPTLLVAGVVTGAAFAIGSGIVQRIFFRR